MRTPALTALAIFALAAVASAQTPAGGEFLVNTYTTGRQETVRAAMEPDGDFVVVWVSANQVGNYHPGVFAQRFAAGGAPQGSEFQVNTYTSGTPVNVAVQVGRRGDFVVVWDSDQDGSGRSIHARRYDPEGDPIGDEFQVNTITTSNQFRPRVAGTSDGRFVVSWSTPTVDGSDYGIAARRFDASGNGLGGEFAVNAYTTGRQVHADLAVEANGDFVAVWMDYNARDGFGTALFGQRYDASGNRLGGEFQVNSSTSGGEKYPSVSVSPAGGFVVTWLTRPGDGSGDGVFARRFDSSGNALGSDFVVNTYTTGYQQRAQVAHDARGNFVVTWHGPGIGGGGTNDAFAQRFSASGARRGAEFQVNTYTTSHQADTAIAADAVGNFVVAWDSFGQDGDLGGIFAQRFGGLGPAALAVNSTGNQVLEPGETVDVRPAWRNSNGGALSFGGTLTEINGPAGAAYTINDGTGDYGSVAHDTAPPCADCYTITVSDPTARPAMHWDASAVESIVPDTLGQQKQWLLHVGRSFDDVPVGNGFYRFIETLLHHGVTSGCSATAYCPGASTTRDAMSVFVLVAKEGAGYIPPACTTPMFDDVPANNPFCRWIEELARRAVVSGCGNDNYCPTDPVTREQMAVFVLRTLDPALQPPACTTPLYTDVPATSGFCRWIEELTRRNVVTGCGPGLYCPGAPVTREQMGVFISATFGLTLYGP